MAAHENFTRADTVHRSSNRTFGLVMGAFFVLMALLPLVRGHAIRIWALPCAVAFLLAALLAPRMLGPLNQAWTALGAAVHKITNPVVLGVLFYLVFVPFGWLLRRMGADFLRLKRPPETESYWILRRPPGPEPASMSKQF
jgi:hypothetical protein